MPRTRARRNPLAERFLLGDPGTVSRCIYCPRQANSREDWLPRGLGRIKGMTVLKDRICTECNNALGRELDEEMLRTGQFGFMRSLLGIRGRDSHTPVNTFLYKGTDSIPPTRLSMPLNYQGIDILGEFHRTADGMTIVKALRQIVVRNNDALVCVPFNRAWKAEHLAAALANKGLEKATLVHVFLGDGEDLPALESRRVLTEVFGPTGATFHFGLDPSIHKADVQLVAKIGGRYLRGLAKLAFHYALWAVPSLSGHEGHFRSIRDYIRWGSGEGRHFVQLNGEQFVERIRQGMVPEVPCHFLMVNATPVGIATSLQFFVGAPDHLFPPARITLSKADAGNVNCAHVVKLLKDPAGSFDGELIDISN